MNTGQYEYNVHAHIGLWTSWCPPRWIPRLVAPEEHSSRTELFRMCDQCTIATQSTATNGLTVDAMDAVADAVAAARPDNFYGQWGKEGVAARQHPSNAKMQVLLSQPIHANRKSICKKYPIQDVAMFQHEYVGHSSIGAVCCFASVRWSLAGQ